MKKHTKQNMISPTVLYISRTTTINVKAYVCHDFIKKFLQLGEHMRDDDIADYF